MEQQIQSKIKKKLEKEGFLVVKLIKTSLNGIPDLMVLKDGEVFFVEVKQANGKLSELQKFRIDELKNKGFRVEIWTDYETPKRLLCLQK
jgi:Holliday junction resolvase